MSDANRVALRASEEINGFGIEISTPDLATLVITGVPDLGFAPETVKSAVLRADRQVSDLSLVGGEASGSVPSELRADVHDQLLEAAFFSSFAGPIKWANRQAVDDISDVATAGDEFTVVNKGAALLVGAIVRAEGFTNAGNNGFHIVNGAPGVTTVPVATNLVDEAAPPINATLTHCGHRAGTGDTDATASPDTITDGTLDYTTLGLQVGDWVRLDGFTTPATANNGFARVSIIAAGVLTFDQVPTGWVAKTEAGTVDIYLGRRLTNGTTLKTFLLEEEFGDHSPVTFQYFRGCGVDGMEVNMPSQELAVITFTFSGKDSFFSDGNDPSTVISTDGGTGRATGAITYPPLPRTGINTSSNVARISRSGIVIAAKNFVTEVSFVVANNLRQLNAVGFLGAVQLGVGTFDVTGDLTTYFDDKSLAEDVVNNTETSLQIALDDGNGHGIVIDVPRSKYSEGSPEVPGENDDTTLPLSYQGIEDSVKGYTALWQTFNFQN